MQSVPSVKTQYLGVNAHLYSFWQGESKWNRFHYVRLNSARTASESWLTVVPTPKPGNRSELIKGTLGQVLKRLLPQCAA